MIEEEGEGACLRWRRRSGPLWGGESQGGTTQTLLLASLVGGKNNNQKWENNESRGIRVLQYAVLCRASCGGSRRGKGSWRDWDEVGRTQRSAEDVGWALVRVV